MLSIVTDNCYRHLNEKSSSRNFDFKEEFDYHICFKKKLFQRNEDEEKMCQTSESPCYACRKIGVLQLLVNNIGLKNRPAIFNSLLSRSGNSQHLDLSVDNKAKEKQVQP